MKKILIPALLLLSSVSYAADNYKVLRVIDGDTVEISAPFLPKPLKPEMGLRILGIDTPEKDFRAQCDSENKLGHAATDFTTNLVKNAKRIKVEIVDKDKYFRLLGNLIIDGKSLADSLIENKLAREYHGEKKESWCLLN